MHFVDALPIALGLLFVASAHEMLFFSVIQVRSVGTFLPRRIASPAYIIVT
jgi:hypothetical protein